MARGRVTPIRKYIIASLTPEEDRVPSHVIAIKEFPRYLAALPNSAASEILYSDIVSAPKLALALAEKLNLFSTRAINDLIDNGKLNMAIPYLAIFKPEYDEYDLNQMKGLARRLKGLPKLGKVEMSKGIFSTSMKYICPDGHINNPECTYCEHSGCGKNIYGLTRDMMQTIDSYNYMVDVLEDMIQHS